MSRTAVFFRESFESCSKFVFQRNSVLFHGDAVDDRGEAATQIKGETISKKVLVKYNPDSMSISIDGEEVSADLATEKIKPLVAGKNVALESTTLGFAELFLLVNSLVEIKFRSINIVYIEPREYTKTKPGADSFALSSLNAGYKPIPRAVVDLAGDDVEAGVFFLGFEPERLERAFEEYQMLSRMDIKVVFGIPAFHPGWELHSITPHLKSIDNCDVQYCAANDPGAAYEALEITKSSLHKGNKMFVAPIGTKPCGIATAVFASINSEEVGLLFDHRTKSSGRSTGVGPCHSYTVSISYDS